MRKSIAATFAVAFPLLVKSTRMKTYVWIAIVLLAGCTTTQLRWDAIGMRQQVMRYYNDEIVENLIRAKEKLPFVHLDITGLTTIDTSQLTGMVGAGETRTNMNASRSMTGILGTITNAVMRPFAYSVSPQRGNSLQISAAPVLGPLAADSQATESSSGSCARSTGCTPAPEKSPAPDVLDASKVTETRKPPEGAEKVGKLEKTVTEFTPKAPKTTTIYELYKEFLCKHPNALVGPKSLIPRPGDAEFVEGTLKIWHGRYYYIDKNCGDAYFAFCITLFTKTQTNSVAKQLQATATAVEGARGLQALPQSPR